MAKRLSEEEKQRRLEVAEEKKRKVKEEKKERQKKAKLSEEENEDRKKLLDYVFNLLGYSTGQKMGRTMALRIEGLRNGQYIGNTKYNITRVYDYKMILYTFILTSAQIKQALATVAFKDEYHKLNYIMVIVESNINDIYNSIQKKKQADEELSNKTITVNVEAPNRYQKKSESGVTQLFDDSIW